MIDPKSPQPGIYRDVPDAIYHAIDFASAHRLADCRRSPAHCRFGVLNAREISPQMKFGTAIHDYIIRPKEFSKRYVISGQCVALMGSGKNAGAACTAGGIKRDEKGNWLCGIHSKGVIDNHGGEVITQKMFDDIEGRADIVCTNPNVQDLLPYVTERELTIIYQDEATGLLIKTRIDMIAPDLNLVIDLKSTRDARQRQFMGQAEAMGYYIQAAINLAACQTHGIDVDKWTAIAFENAGYCGVKVYPFSDAVIEIGRKELKRLIPLYAECQRSGEWSAYDTSVEEVDLAAWKMREAYFEAE